MTKVNGCFCWRGLVKASLAVARNDLRDKRERGGVLGVRVDITLRVANLRMERLQVEKI